MKNFFKDNILNIISLSRNVKKTIAITSDIIICVFSVWLAFVLRLDEIIFLNSISATIILISVILAIPIFWICGVYKTLFRYASSSVLTTLCFSTLVYGSIYFMVISVYGIRDVPRSIGILQPILFFLGTSFSRIFVKFLLTGSFNQLLNLKNKQNVLIYGAGNAGTQLLTSLENSFQYRVIGFLDDNFQLQNHNLLGRRIYNPKMTKYLKESKNVDLILFAIPSISKTKKNEIIKKLSKYKLTVKSLPNVNDIIDGKISVSDIKDYLPDDLLVRDEIKPDQDLLDKNIKFKSVLVTGAGGTIGSELCHQIIKLKPKQLILVEINEYALYNIHDELLNINNDLKIIPLLSNIQDQKNLENIFEIFKIDTIYHAAAYKHVPLVEANICEGIKNNVFGTLSVVKASINQKVENLVLISTDKAVRPTNIMGVSKRFAELCFQGLYNKNDIKNCNFSIVRFGNVINSSGSVIPKFKKQISNGGPITLTHPEVTRYFMTISEASQLVIQAGAMAKKCEVFVLDMGKSVKIRDLIKRMVKFAGLTIKDINNKDGDIEIKITGLRPGEKLYEELLIGNNPQKTIHPKIKKINEPFIPFNELQKILDKLSNLLDNYQSEEVKELLNEKIRLYNPSYSITDYREIEVRASNNKKDLSSSLSKKNNIFKLDIN